MIRRSTGPVRAGLAALAVLAAPVAAAEVPPPVGVSMTQPGQSDATQAVILGLNKSTVIDLERPAADLVITNAEIADAVVQTRQRLIFRGVQVGQTNAFIYDDEGREILNLEITVENDLGNLNELLARHVPNARVRAESVNGSVVLSGNVKSVSESETVVQLAKLYAGEDAQIANMLSVAAKDQVLLEVRVVEMQRTFLKQLGINPSADVGFGDLANQVSKELFVGNPPVSTGQDVLAPGLPFSNTTDFGFQNNLSSDAGLSGQFGYNNYVGDDLQTEASLAIEALERVGIARTLAEPNITAVSGETANFLAGGEYPVPGPPDEFGRVGIEFKQFGVGLGFTPIVLSEDRISLKVSTEVSELSEEGSVQGVPALAVRRVESTVELPSGKSMMLAGLIQTRSRQTLDQIPGIKNVPVLGQLFQSRDFTNSETELVVIITPYLVDPTTKARLRTPADGMAFASDTGTLIWGRLNRLYGDGETEVDGESYQAPIGFIEE